MIQYPYRQVFLFMRMVDLIIKKRQGLELSDEEMKSIEMLDRDKSIFGAEYNPITGKALYFLSELRKKFV